MGVLYPFFGIRFSFFEFGKNANSFNDRWIVEHYPTHLKFVWRQLEFAFFGALTSVGALFDFKRNLIKKDINRKANRKRKKEKNK